MRSVGSEFLSVAEVFAIPLLIAAAFPYGAVGFSASRAARPADGSTASIVFLDDATAARAVREARIMSRNGNGGRMRIDLLSPELPDAGNEQAVTTVPRLRPRTLPIVESGIPPFLPSRRAVAPIRISAEVEKGELTFSRDELLKLNR